MSTSQDPHLHNIPTENRKLIRELASLQQEDETLYDILAVDIWALSKTIDEFQPGFWTLFMKNRDRSLKQFIQDVLKQKPAQGQKHPFTDTELSQENDPH